MKISVRIMMHLFLAAAIAVGADPVFAQPQPGEYEMKAASLYNFLTFVEWPATMKREDALRVCVMAEPPVLNAFSELNGKIAAGRKIETRHLTSHESLGPCHVLFIGSHAERDLSRILKSLEETGVLTIGDTAGFARQGVMVNLYLQDKKVRFEINAAAARRAGITISSRLLKLAGSVYGAPEGD